MSSIFVFSVNWSALTGGNCKKSPTAMTMIPAKGMLPLEAKISVNWRWICNKRSLETIETSSIINTFTSDNLFS